MALYIDTDECISCGDCEPDCPTSSISEGILSYQINKNTCTECEGEFETPVCVDACPIDNCIQHLD